MSKMPLPHALADDLESFLHVLSWVALRFMDHDLDSERLSSLLATMFDYSYESKDGVAQGGVAKKNFLIGAEILASGFRNNNIVSLLAVLTKTIAARYEAPPIQFDMYLSMPGQNFTDQITAASAAAHQEKLKALETSDWILETFRKVTANRRAWPPADKSEEEARVRISTQAYPLNKRGYTVNKSRQSGLNAL